MIGKVLVSISNVDLEIDKGIWSGCFTVSTGSLDVFRATRMHAECLFSPDSGQSNTSRLPTHPAISDAKQTVDCKKDKPL